MDNTKIRRSLSRLYTLSLIALLAVVILPATRWLVTSQTAGNFAPLGSRTNGWLYHELGVKEGSPYNTEPIQRAVNAVNTSEPNDYGLQYATILMTPQNNAPSTYTSPNSRNPLIDDLLFRLHELSSKYRTLPRAQADFLRQAGRNMSVGQIERQALADDYLPTSPVKPAPYDPAVERTQLLYDMRGAAIMGEQSEPDNGFFPLMQAVVADAFRQDGEALICLHHAAQCPRYEDYAMEEAKDLNRMAERAFGRQSVIADVAQGASVLLPHYAQFRAVARLAVVSANEKEATGDLTGGIAIREDILKVGGLMRKQSSLLIGNLVGAAIEAIAGARPGGVPQTDRPQRNSTLSSDERAAEKLNRFTAYLDAQERPDLSAFARTEDAARIQLRTINEKASDMTAFGGRETFLLGLWHTLGAVILANAFWLVFFGGLATFLLKKKLKSSYTAVAIIACWIGIAAGYSWYNAPNQTAYASTISVLYNLSGTPVGQMSDVMAAMRVASLLSFAVPMALILLIGFACLFSRVPMSLGLLRGLRGLCLPAAAFLVLLWVPVLGMTLHKENKLKADYHGYLQNEGRHLARLAGMPFPE